MDNSKSIKESIWSQFGASLDMLENAITMCPDENWDTEIRFWYDCYHCIFWTDYYLTTEPSKFTPPPPFTFSEFDPTGKLPDRTYTKTEVLSYLEHCRKKANLIISELTSEKLNQRWINEYKNYSQFEILIYNIRHIQHHSAQLNLLLRQTINNAPNWVGQAKKN
ncbi:DinB family protein [Moheibacter sediminis]|uniref:DinB superfamily protein n=1 Tax=Moheibacter sediminis TaxID=1434700 RepID=A0A1W2BDV2_9FLAO|nr:DinB family protein [Moheibacter sediminis]SMC71014.1 DinB superfamily protein [Moheibacter sediminis]